MDVAELVSDFAGVVELPSQLQHCEVKAIAGHSLHVEPGTVFLYPGPSDANGIAYIAEAIRRGAVAVLVDAAWDWTVSDSKLLGRLIQVPNARKAMAIVARRFYGTPDSGLKILGITGTNGKTTTAFLTAHILNSVGIKTGLITTILHKCGQKTWPSDLTTPGPVEFFARLAEFKKLAASAAVFEVSSHALAQHRVDAADFDAVAFTNFSRDHLDYHHSMQAYFAAKERLVHDLIAQSHKPSPTAILNWDVAMIRESRVAPNAQVIRFGSSDEVEFQHRLIDESITGVRYQLRCADYLGEVSVPLTGRHNIENSVAAIVLSASVGVPVAAAVAALRSAPSIPGRLERVVEITGRQVFVDFAHTPDGLETVLASLKRVAGPARVILVFGCGGERDAGKRPLMMKAALKFADFVVVTSDNPRGEDPNDIIQDILKGTDQVASEVHVEVDRRAAIREALRRSKVKDIVLIAGKGHESTQHIGLIKHVFSDYQVAKEVAYELSI